MTVITYRIRLIEPVLATKLDGDPNSNVSANYLPGSALRAALLMRFAQSRDVKPAEVLDSPVTGADAARLFFGTNRFLNGYPVDRTEHRALPRPLSWHQSKDEKKKAADGEHAPVLDFAWREKDEKQYEKADGAFVSYLEDADRKVYSITPARQVMVHTQRAIKNRNLGRATEGDGAVFRYESLAAGQEFAAAIACDKADTVNFLTLLKGEYILGGARTAGYGRVSIESAKAEPDNWRETSTPISIDDNEIVVTLTSDMLLRDVNGQLSASPDEFVRHLQARLDSTSARVSMKPEDRKYTFAGMALVGGFNRKWGLPLTQAPALSMGSTFRLQITPALPVEVLQKIETEGMGERRIDGFGSLVFGWQQDEELSIHKEESSKHRPVAISQEKLSAESAKWIARRMLRAKIENLLLERAGDIEVQRSPKRSQLSRLRNIVMNMLQEPMPAPTQAGKPPVDRISRFLDDAIKRNTTREQWQSARIKMRKDADSERLVDWLRQAHNAESADGKKWPDSLGVSERPAVKIGDISVVMDVAMQREFTMRLMAEVLKRAAKESKKGVKQP